MEILYEVFEIISIISFSISGSLVGIKSKMDIFGISILGLTTAVGGGIIRDIILGVNPPISFINPKNALISIISSIILFILYKKHRILLSQNVRDKIMLISDSIGLGIFTVSGVYSGFSLGYEHDIFLLIFIGVLTGCGGGLLRDITSNNLPYIFTKHFYACASIIGALITSILLNYINTFPSLVIGFIIIFVLRLMAAHYRWELPK